MTGTVDAEKIATSGGVVPGGSVNRMVCTIAVVCASAVWMFAVGWKKIFTIDVPFRDCDSMCSTSFTSVVTARSELEVIRCSISWGSSP